jgi:hypothetical protein
VKLWSVTWERIWIGFARAADAADAADAIRIMQAKHPQIEGGEWVAVEVP